MTTRFVLYVAGDTARSARAAASMRRLCDLAQIADDSIEVVDVLERPALADEHGILATPTVISHAPHASRRVIGDLSDVARLASALDIDVEDAGLAQDSAR